MPQQENGVPGVAASLSAPAEYLASEDEADDWVAEDNTEPDNQEPDDASG